MAEPVDHIKVHCNSNETDNLAVGPWPESISEAEDVCLEMESDSGYILISRKEAVALGHKLVKMFSPPLTSPYRD